MAANERKIGNKKPPEEQSRSNGGERKDDEMENLKLETLTDLKMHGKTAEDVRWVGTRERKIPLDVFWKEADRTYDDGFGGAEVNECLMVVGDDWWLERHEYDGAEWWE